MTPVMTSEMTPALEIRPIEVSDILVLAELHALSFTDPWDQSWNARAFAEILAMPGAGGQIATIGEQPVGFALARIAADEAELLSIGVRPEWRRAGTAGRLLAEVLRGLAAAGVARVFLEVAVTNRKAREFYRKAGFDTVGSRPGYYQIAQPLDAPHGNGNVDAVILAYTLVAEEDQHPK